MYPTRGAQRTWIKAAVLRAAVLLLFAAPGVPAPSAAVGEAETAPPGAPTPGTEDHQGSSDGPVIPAGQEPVLGQMLGLTESLPGQCKVAGAKIDRNIVTATYRCSTGDVVFELRHPSAAPWGATTTAQFAVTVQSGTPPEGLTDAVVALIRAHEATFQWTGIGTGASGRFPSLTAVIAAASLVSVGFGVFLRRRRSATKT